MGTAQKYFVPAQVNSEASEIIGITDPTLVIDSLISPNRKIQQVIITNDSVLTLYVKFWNRAIGSAPTIGTITLADTSTITGWSNHPDMILPVAPNETADYTFLGEDHFAFTNGIIFNVGQRAGTDATSSGVISAAVTIFVNT